MRSRATGFTLLEMIVALGLIAMAMEIAVPIIRWSIIDVHNTQIDSGSAACLDRAMDALRQDVWQAREIHTPTIDHLTLSSNSGGEITWQLDADGSLERGESSAANQQWTTFLNGVSFTRDGPVVLVTIAASPGRPGSTISMMSPASLYSGQHP